MLQVGVCACVCCVSAICVYGYVCVGYQTDSFQQNGNSGNPLVILKQYNMLSIST